MISWWLIILWLENSYIAFTNDYHWILYSGTDRQWVWSTSQVSNTTKKILSRTLPGATLKWISHTSSVVLQWSFGGCRSGQRAWLHSPSVYSCSLSPDCSVSAEPTPYYYLTTGNFSYLLFDHLFKNLLCHCGNRHN